MFLLIILAYANKKRKNKDAEEETRFRILYYFKNSLGPQKQAPSIFALRERVVNKIRNKYKTEGKRSLFINRRGVKRGKKINGK